VSFQDDIAARTIWGEARGETPEGRLAVAFVIRNRVKYGRWGMTPAAVCFANMQFSCWNPGDPNRRKMLELSDTDHVLELCMEAWLESARLSDTVGGALHYKVRNTYARWAEGSKPYVTIGHHEFYVGIAA